MTMTVTEAASRLGITPQGVRNAIAAGSLAARKERVAGRSPLRPVFLLEEDEVERYAADRGGGAKGRERAKATSIEEMAKRGLRPVAAAAAELGVSQQYLGRLVREGKVPGTTEGGLFMEEDAVTAFKAERERKLAGVGNV